MTFLALGNGAPDISSSIAAIASSNFEMALGALLGAPNWPLCVPPRPENQRGVCTHIALRSMHHLPTRSACMESLECLGSCGGTCEGIPMTCRMWKLTAQQGT